MFSAVWKAPFKDFRLRRIPGDGGSCLHPFLSQQQSCCLQGSTERAPEGTSKPKPALAQEGEAWEQRLISAGVRSKGCIKQQLLGFFSCFQNRVRIRNKCREKLFLSTGLALILPGISEPDETSLRLTPEDSMESARAPPIHRRRSNQVTPNSRDKGSQLREAAPVYLAGSSPYDVVVLAVCPCSCSLLLQPYSKRALCS